MICISSRIFSTEITGFLRFGATVDAEGAETGAAAAARAGPGASAGAAARAGAGASACARAGAGASAGSGGI